MSVTRLAFRPWEAGKAVFSLARRGQSGATRRALRAFRSRTAISAVAAFSGTHPRRAGRSLGAWTGLGYVEADFIHPACPPTVSPKICVPRIPIGWHVSPDAGDKVSGVLHGVGDQDYGGVIAGRRNAPVFAFLITCAVYESCPDGFFPIEDGHIVLDIFYVEVIEGNRQLGPVRGVDEPHTTLIVLQMCAKWVIGWVES